MKSLNLEPRFYSVKETATILQVSEREVRRLIKTGELGAVFFGKKQSRIRIPNFIIEEFAKERLATAKSRR